MSVSFFLSHLLRSGRGYFMSSEVRLETRRGKGTAEPLLTKINKARTREGGEKKTELSFPV